MTSSSTATRPFVGLVRALRERFEAILRELGKFGIVGAICYVIDVGIFNLVLGPTGQPLFASAISTIIATTFAFVGNRFWTWRDRDRSGLTREYVLYFFVNLVGLGIGLACLAISHYWLGAFWPALTTPLADNIAGKVIGVGFASAFRFWAYRRYVFRTVTSDAAA